MKHILSLNASHRLHKFARKTSGLKKKFCHLLRILMTEI